jgi:probable rRNA maturation factor
MLGDIVLARETVVAEALQRGKSVSDHLSHLIVHGVLHLLGYDHGARAETREMRHIEIQILDNFGITNPYESQVGVCTGIAAGLTENR